jgi:hypothetical protein
MQFSPISYHFIPLRSKYFPEQFVLSHSSLNIRDQVSHPCKTYAYIVFFSVTSRLALWPTRPPVQWVPGALSLGAKRQGREADHLLPPSAEVKNGGSVPLPPHTS